MQKNEAGHRQCTLYRGEVFTHLLREVSARIRPDLVSDVVSEMRATMRQHAQRLAEVDRADHKAKQYAMCSECRERITVADLQANECFNCGSPILSKKGTV